MEYAEPTRQAIARWRNEIESLNRENANDCAKLAEKGIFVEVGQKCGFCLHGLPGDCRLRLMAQK